MRRFEKQPDGTLVAVAEDAELQLLATLAHQVADLVAATDAADPALQRLLPDAYTDDPEASAEFRRFTQPDLVSRKVHNAHAIIASVSAASDDNEITLDGEAAACWLRGLNDIRLIVAARLGIESDDDNAGRELDPMMRDVYDWLGFVQNSLVEALDA